MSPLFKSMENCSFPVRPRESAFCPSMNSKGRTPIPTKLDLWILSKDSAMTALTPYSRTPLAAQSLEDPLPYSLPAIIILGCPFT